MYVFNLTIFSYFLGVKAKTNKKEIYNSLLLLIVVNIIINLINIGKGIQSFEIFSVTKILFCFIIWSFVVKLYNKKIFILVFFAISLLIGFYKIDSTISYLICLFPFFLIGYNIDYDFKLNRKLKFLIGILLFICTIGIIIIILNKFYVSMSILQLSSYSSRKHLIFRLGYFAIALVMIFALNLLFNNNKLKIIEKYGKNSLLTFACILMLTFLFSKIADISYYNNLYILYAIIFCLLLIIITGNEITNNFVNKLFEKIKNNTFLKVSILMLIAISLVIPNLKVKYTTYEIYDRMTEREIADISNSVSISFVGDLILLQNQIKSAYDGNNYNFDKMFDYTKKYLEKSDLSIGVLEGPVSEGEYTTGNFDDNVELRLNFPNSFLHSIKNAGIDLVTISNNHLLDKGVEAVKETVDSLNDVGLDYVGVYNNRYKIMDVEGIKIGILSYTYGANFYTEDELIEEDITSVIVAPSSPNFSKAKLKVEQDFENIKKYNVDLIVVLPHMGTQFSHEVDVFQNTWNDIFISNGASIIFGDHSHAVQSIEYKKDAIIINCPGNFANQYTEKDGDATSIVEVYVDKETKKVITSSIVPMYTYSSNDGFYKALPIYDIVNDKTLYNNFSIYEMQKVKEINKLITRTMINTEVDIYSMEEKLYYYRTGYKRNNSEMMEISNSDTEKELYKILKNATSVCFIGDSITAGTKNGGYGWYEPLINNFDIKVSKVAYGSYTTTLMLKKKTEEIKKCNSDLYVIAIGTNDIRYQDSVNYIENVQKISNIILEQNSNATLVFIAPWMSLDSDAITSLSVSKKNKLFDFYTKELNKLCIENNYIFIDPNPLIKQKLSVINSNYYLVDYIHPNKINGIQLYSWAVLQSS